ncbi:DUF6236 family protein [Streptomyces collinus]|uniref:DUF6236 family protein n=1 Tax=Streptomyces collinus TaxID=42684 RepID=UPI003651A5ED
MAWLKQSLLYWDHLCAIVPDNFWDDPDPTLVWLADQGLFEPLVIDNLSTSAMSDFQSEVKEVAKHAKRGRLHVPHIAENIDFFHLGKLPYAIEDELRSDSLVRDSAQGHLLTHKELVWCVLGLAAKHLSRDFTMGDRHYAVHTDSAAFARLAFKPFPGETSTPGSVIQIVLRDLLPVPNESVAFSDVLEFKETYRQELLHFRRALDSLHVSLNEELAGNPGAAAGIRDEFEMILMDLKSAFSRKRLAFMTIGVSVLVGMALGSVAPTLTDTISWQMGGFGAGLLSAVSTQVRDAPRIGDFSYLYRVRRELGS